MIKRVLLSTIAVIAAMVATAADYISIAHGPYLQNVTDTEATIVWKANKPSIGWVELAPDDGTNYYNSERPRFFDTTNGVKNESELHVVKLKGLKPGTNYRYRVYAQEVLEHKGWQVKYGNIAALDVWQSQPPVFTTSDPSKPRVSFAMINDIHGRTDDIPALMKAADCKKKDLVIFNGDMLSQLRNEEELFTGFMDVSVKLFASETPMYYARGNHETRGVFATCFQNYFSPKQQNLYYMFRHGPVCFVVLDTGEDKPDSDLEYSGITDYDAYRTEQAEWLREAVKSPVFTEAPYRVVIAHMPPQPIKELWHGPQEVLEKFVPILNEAGVDVMLSGHLHRYINCPADDRVKFPVIINAHRTVVDGSADDSGLDFKIFSTDGSLVDRIHLPKRR